MNAGPPNLLRDSGDQNFASILRTEQFVTLSSLVPNTMTLVLSGLRRWKFEDIETFKYNTIIQVLSFNTSL